MRLCAYLLLPIPIDERFGMRQSIRQLKHVCGGISFMGWRSGGIGVYGVDGGTSYHFPIPTLRHLLLSQRVPI